jgi:hypothetical protein
MRNVLRTNYLASTSFIPEEWNIPHPPPISEFVKIGSRSRERSCSVCLDYIPFGDDLEGISACARAGTTIRVFAHRQGKTTYATFVKKLRSIFDDADLTFTYFPLVKNEKIQEVGIRKMREMGGPTSFRTLTVSNVFRAVSTT